MRNLFSELFHRKSETPTTRTIDQDYVSDYTRFIEHFVDEHPEVREEQHCGWRIYWDKRVDLAALEEARKDSAPNDGYGFYFSAWKPENSATTPKIPKLGAINAKTSTH